MRIAKLLALAAIPVTGLLGGCTNYTILSATDHATQPVTQFEVLKTTNYLISFTQEHIFWLCTDTGNALSCERRCGGTTDLQCPALSAGIGGIQTNVR